MIDYADSHTLGITGMTAVRGCVLALLRMGPGSAAQRPTKDHPRSVRMRVSLIPLRTAPPTDAGCHRPARANLFAMVAGLSIRPTMSHGRFATYVVVALLMSFCLFYVLDIDGPSLLATSTTEIMAIDATEADEIRHPSLLGPLAIVLVVLQRGTPGVNALSDQGAHPVVTSPVVPRHDRICPETLPRSALPDPEPAAV